MASACAGDAPAQSRGAGANPSQLYDRACARCHAADGSGGLPMAQGGGPRPIDFRDRDWQRSRSDVELTAAIRDGRGAMPPFNDVLTESEIAALAAYVRALGSATDHD